MSKSTSRPPHPDKYDTPLDWLMFVHYLTDKPRKLVHLTAEIIDGLARVEAHTALAMLQIHRTGKTMPKSAIEDIGRREVASSTMAVLVFKGFAERREDTPNTSYCGHARGTWALTASGAEKLEAMETGLSALIVRAKRAVEKGRAA